MLPLFWYRRFGNPTASRLPAFFSASAFAFRTLKTAQARDQVSIRPRLLPSLFETSLCRTPSMASLRCPPFQASFTNHWLLDQALDRLVSSSSIRYRTSTDDLSTLSSSRGLTCFCSGNSILQGGFTLRCLQRLSRPHFASQLCRWHDNCCTRGASIRVLSY